MIISFDEVYPLWCVTERYLGEFDTHSAVCECSHHLPFYTCLIHEGGLGFRLNQIGISLSVIGVLLLPLSLFIFPVVSTQSIL